MGGTIRRLDQLGTVRLLARARADQYTGPWNAHTKNPILVIGTTFDPATPYANARRVARLLGNAILLTHAGYGHTSEADPSKCVTDATSSYLVDLITPPGPYAAQTDNRLIPNSASHFRASCADTGVISPRAVMGACTSSMSLPLTNASPVRRYGRDRVDRPDIRRREP